MSGQSIHYLKIANFKSIDVLEVRNLKPFSVFAGANASGKSNFFDTLDFVRTFIESGAEIALRTHGRYENVHSQKRRANFSRKFDFEISCDLPDNRDGREGNLANFHYTLGIYDLDKSSPQVEEKLIVDNKVFFTRAKGGPLILKGDTEEREEHIEKFPQTYSALLSLSNIPISRFLQNTVLYRIDPLGAKEPDKSDQDPYLLDRKGHNVASVLNRLEKNSEARDTIIEWMQIIAPGVEGIQSEHQQLDGKTAVLFKERGIKRRFPAHLVSDGTIYALCLLVAVLDPPSDYGMVLIEEPERGLHPKAIRELVGLIREQATPANPIWLSTHSESVVRQLKLDELVLVDKVDGRTKMRSAASGKITDKDLAPLGLDEAWLSNLLGGGIPW